MKQLIFLLGCVFFVGMSRSVYDQEFLSAHQWMAESGMTRYTDVDEFDPESRVTREQAAKFFVEFDRVVMGRDVETMMFCAYGDEQTFDPTLAGSIQSACNRQLMVGSQGIFSPQAPLTKAQTLTILVRSLQGTQEETGSPRWGEYFRVAQSLKLTKELDVWSIDRPITRYELALLLWRVNNPLQDSEEADIQEILGILEELGLQTE